MTINAGEENGRYAHLCRRLLQRTPGPPILIPMSGSVSMDSFFANSV